MLSVLGWLVKIYNLLNQVFLQNGLILTSQQQMQTTIAGIKNVQDATKVEIDDAVADLATIKLVLGIGVPVSETIEWGLPKP